MCITLPLSPKSLSYVMATLGAPKPSGDGDPYFPAGAPFLASKFNLCLVLKNDKVLEAYIDAEF
ncbi:MAG: hypothetical protein IAF58_10435 [Leptolyngbya sp.]|nr:hypothetical protein [Candidatus Melainabacteria bacterium]